MKLWKMISFLFGYLFLFGFFLGLGYLFYFLYQAGYSTSLVALIIFYGLANFFMFILFIQRRNASAKLSWAIIMTLIPGIGHFTFVFFGQRYRYRKSLAQYRTKKTFNYEMKNITPNLQTTVKKVFLQQQNISQRGIYAANYKIFIHSYHAYESLFSDLKKARKFIHLQYYILKPGEIYEHFKSILIAKAKVGVKVRLIVDDFGRWALPWYEIRELQKCEIEVQIFGRVHFPFIGSANGYRNHRKIVIIDGKIVYTGGMNIGDEYASLDVHYGYWVDSQIKITGPAVRSYSLLFIDCWEFLSNQHLPIEKLLLETNSGQNYGILVEESPEIQASILEMSLTNWILNAKKSISLSTPYFILTPQIFSALKTAALSGVKVTIYLPGKVDKKAVIVASRYYAKELSAYGVTFREIKHIFIHSKVGLFDERYAYVGSANIDMRSFYSQLETISLIAGRVTKDFKKLFSYYDSISQELDFKNYQVNKIFNRILRAYASLMSPVF